MVTGWVVVKNDSGADLFSMTFGDEIELASPKGKISVIADDTGLGADVEGQHVRLRWGKNELGPFTVWFIPTERRATLIALHLSRKLGRMVCVL